MQAFHRDETPYSGYSKEHAHLNNPLLTDKVAGWRSKMRDRDRALFEAIAGESLRRYGYPIESTAGELSRVQQVYFKWIEHPPRKAAALLRNRPGHREEFQLFMMRMRLIARYVASGGRR
jgi:hypothetical protein